MFTRQLIATGALAMLLATAPAFPAGSEVADAVMKKNGQAVRSLLQQKADVNAPQVDGAAIGSR